MTPLDVFETRWLGNLANNPGMSFRYIESVNAQVELEVMPDKWASAIIQPETDRDLTLGSRPIVVQRGVIVVGLFGKSGRGQKILDAEIQQLRDCYHGWMSDGVHFMHVDGPLDVDPAADGEWWRLAFTVNYEWSRRRDAIGRGFEDLQGLLTTPITSLIVGDGISEMPISDVGEDGDITIIDVLMFYEGISELAISEDAL